ncbi:MAG: ABC transporter substrate-binding protein [Proteobacteria bacterium]|nr:ABC transporter substrate-binding protein [Pseudomonadota bacterium]MBI3495827.1 ABC transporter substrate-binding protein [Pseudomonadota bacterium]
MRAWIFVVAPMLLASVAGSAEPPKVLRYAPAADLTSLDAQTNGALVTAEYGMMVYDTLFSMDATLVPRPQMIEAYTVAPDGLSYALTLRAGLKFHDGAPVTSADVIPSIRRWMKRDPLGRKMDAALAAFEADGSGGFRMTFKTRFPFVEMALAWTGSGMAAILPRASAETDAFKPVTQSVGSGPFRFLPELWRIGNSAAWERNPDYMPRAEPPNGLAGGKVAKLDRIELKYLPDAGTRANALKAGEIDLIDLLPVDLVAVLRPDRNIVVDRLSPFGGEGVIRMNHLQPPFDNLKARQALALTVVQAEFMGAAYGDPAWWEPSCFSWFVCGSQNGTAAGSEPYRQQDLARAKELLAESGYRGEPIVIVTAADVPSQYAMAQVAAANLRKIGAAVDLQIVDFGQVMVRRENRNPPAAGGWNLIVLGFNGMFLSSPITNPAIDSRCGEALFGWPCDETVERLRTEYMNEADAERRRPILEALSRAAWASLPSVLTGMYYNAYAWRSDVKDLLHATQLVFWNVDKVR